MKKMGWIDGGGLIGRWELMGIDEFYGNGHLEDSGIDLMKLKRII